MTKTTIYYITILEGSTVWYWDGVDFTSDADLKETSFREETMVETFDENIDAWRARIPAGRFSVEKGTMA